MPQEDASIPNPLYYQSIRSFLNTMQDTVKAAFQRRKAADTTPRTHSRSTLAPISTTPPPVLQNLSKYSSPAVPDSTWCSQNFMLGAGMVILQPSTDKVVVLHEKVYKYWFFPKGRKDIGESLETTAIREAYEESGFRATFLPLYTDTRAPAPPDDKLQALRKNTEPVFLSLMSWKARSTQRPAGEYLTTWYVGQIPEDAEYRPGTGMPDEQNYESYLLTYEEAMERLDNPHRDVLRYVWAIYTHTLYLDHLDETRELQDEQRRSMNRVSQKLPPEQPPEQTRRRSHQ